MSGVDYAEKLKELTVKKEQLSTRLTKQQVIKEQTEAAIKHLEDEMKTAGTSPETIENDYNLKEAEVKRKIEEYEQHLKEVEAEVNASEEALKVISI